MLRMAPLIWHEVLTGEKSPEAMAKSTGWRPLDWMGKRDRAVVRKIWTRWDSDSRQGKKKVRENEKACQVIWEQEHSFPKKLRSADLTHFVIEVEEMAEGHPRRSGAQIW